VLESGWHRSKAVEPRDSAQGVGLGAGDTLVVARAGAVASLAAWAAA